MIQSELIEEILNANPSNEAEVETKILLNVFKLLGFSYQDRADKISVKMNFGREQKTKVADFILYDGIERTVRNSLLAVEAKKTSEKINNAENQVISYSAWAGTPYYMVCNGIELMVARLNYFSNEIDKVIIEIHNIKDEFYKIEGFANKTALILNKERLSYIAKYFPKIENLPSAEFFQEYLDRFNTRFSFNNTTIIPLSHDGIGTINLPVSLRLENKNFNVKMVVEKILHSNSFIVIEGEPGSGKSTLCKRIALLLSEKIKSENINALPIYITTRTDVPNDIFAAFKSSCDELGVSVFENMYREKIKTVKTILVLDGFDEISDLERGLKSLEKIIKSQQIYSLLISSRPHLITSLESISDRISVGTMNKLTLGEVKSIAKDFNINYSDLTGISSLDITSPLQLLMIFKLNMDGYISSDLPLIELYRKYIIILNKYFNKDDEDDFIDKLLWTLSNVAKIIVQKEHTGSKISLGELYQEFVEPNQLDNLIKCGLITSKAGSVTFIHKSFEEFGISFALLNYIKNLDEKSIRELPISSDEVYKMIELDLNMEYKSNVFKLLSNKSNKIRNRVVGILKYSKVFDQDELILVEALKIENSIKVKKILFRILSNTKQGTVIIELFQYKGISRRNKADYLKLAHNTLAIKEAINLISKNIEHYKTMNISYWVLYYSLLEGDLYRYFFELIELIISGDSFDKREIFKLLVNKDRDINGIFIYRLYYMLKNERDILNLFKIDFEYINKYEKELKMFLYNHLNEIKGLKFEDYKKIEKLKEDIEMKSI